VPPTRARWTSQEIVVPDDDGDPFQARVEQLGMPVVLDDGRATLNEKLAGLVNDESRLYNAGIRCAVKDNPDATCLACPLSAHDDPSASLRPLCLVGRAQEIVLTQIACAKEDARGDQGPRQ
jgi:hypothetical protein